MKRFFAVVSLLLILTMLFSAFSVPAFAEDDDYYEDDFAIFGGDFTKALGNAFIILLGYAMPLFLIVFSLLKFVKSNNPRKNAWFIMTAVGLATAILATVFMLLTI